MIINRDAPLLSIPITASRDGQLICGIIRIGGFAILITKVARQRKVGNRREGEPGHDDLAV